MQAFRESMNTRRNVLRQARTSKKCSALPEEIIRLIEDCLRTEGRRLGREVFRYRDDWDQFFAYPYVREGIRYNRIEYRYVMVVPHLQHIF